MDEKRVMERVRTDRCLHCGASLRGRYASAKYCTDRCRKAAHLERVKARWQQECPWCHRKGHTFGDPECPDNMGIAEV